MPTTLRLIPLATACTAILCAQPVIEMNERVPVPDWAIAERELLEAASAATEVFSDRYVDERGYLKCVERWGGNDGADDAMENFGGWTLLYALGGDERVLELYKEAWEGHLKQFTEATAPGIEMAEDGMYWREFVTSFDGSIPEKRWRPSISTLLLALTMRSTVNARFASPISTPGRIP